nr:EG45-like domain containing protein [Ipomoea batatas]GMD93578.1 EG45-like domain containing protein [Ipomoea batatas]GME15808.1 EG45-like domain containing protein [Ipomoea batatas]GME20769.1 EG45-like domain containing protein [Ipomoea batatas]
MKADHQPFSAINGVRLRLETAMPHHLRQPAVRQGTTATACFGTDRSQFPSSNYFAAAGEGIWDNGASCGRQYLVSCISSVFPKACKKDQTIQIKIVDRAQTSVSRPTKPGTTMVLSNAAFAAIADPSATSLNIEFQQ